ncbi:2-deoxy-D-gluconate 3-dehydrogenase [Burkholderia sp. MSh2]|uniref:2-deoxy-D-gluconate 3-dehydrogenase n=1 Tax=Burkholderia paludis TaxID=1506587 RepID=A0A6J5E0U8_9BURK|nr:MULTISPECIES: SDR family oxidoreductase [Burkholderia]KEZ02296.1 2-deoxy-D-gluconate 3-dehydrogenase [Burkholderia sp. MSh2]KFG98062.1 2-deoxy-D-gluconate 3-dehydrogenase [Burkholderia paludis]CAB3760029.1 2-dehydro-3-deoxy-D-gluconate 5-dehydrogenase [Burkholderia paludis]VWC06276.1 2-deoxy-D-gluconate 3-dehydrogenase [Burkholderia paludis]
MFDLSEKVAVITGGASGIGFGIAQGMAAAGARVALVGRDPEKGQTALASLPRGHASGRFIQADITRYDDCVEAMAQAERHFGGLDILVNNAGMNIRKQAHELTVEDWHRIVDTNLSGAHYCAQAIHGAFVRAGGGKIVNIGSMLSLFGTTYGSAYAASKGGIVQLGKAWAVEWAPDNIQVNTLLPGWIETDLIAEARRLFPDLEERVLSRTPQRRWGKPQDLAGIAVALCSSECDFITGAVIPVDGGYSIQG